jgi:hypothetical protein
MDLNTHCLKAEKGDHILRNGNIGEKLKEIDSENPILDKNF